MQVVTLLLLVAALGCLIVGLMLSNTLWIVASLVASVLAVLAIRVARRRAEEATARRSQSETELVRPTGAREEIAALAAEAAAERSAASTAPAVEPEAAAEPPPIRRQSHSTQRIGQAVAVADAGWRADVDELPQRTTASEEDETVLPGLTPARKLALKRGLSTDDAADALPADLVVSQPTTDEVAVGDDDPVDEPTPANTLAPSIDKSNENVWVIDGRPRYHLSSCGFLVGQEAEPIPLQQAVEDGFSPCSRCDPDTALASA